ncbi:autotransporter domain-containing protein [Allorhodopirellula solitaria]|uniref:autotransporter domain-containing protein n=1 Tax=Allorhodopirellula solitaria TaxID=2527987 RepID=UPI00164926D1
MLIATAERVGPRKKQAQLHFSQRWKQSGPTGLGPATTRLRLGWFHEYLDDTITLANQFQSSNASSQFASRSVDEGRDWASVGVQLDWGMIWGGRLSGGYQGFYNSDSTFHLGSIGSTWLF